MLFGLLIKGYGLFSLPVFLPLSLFVFDYLPLGFLPSIISLHQNNRYDDYYVIIISDNSGDEGKGILLLSLSLPLQVSFDLKAFAETSVFIKQTLCKEFEDTINRLGLLFGTTSVRLDFCVTYKLRIALPIKL